MSESKEASKTKGVSYSEAAANKAEGGKISEATSSTGTSKKKSSWKKPRSGSSSNPDKKPKFQGGTPGLEEHIFIYGKGMITRWITSKEKLFAYIGKKYSMSEVKSLENGKPTLIGYIKPKEVKNEQQMRKWSYIKKEEWKLNLKRWNEQKAILTRNLSACYAIIWGQMTLTLRNKVKKDPSYNRIYETLNAPKLFAVMSRICNEADTVDHAESRLVESLYSLLMCTGGNMSLPEYYEIFTHRVKSAKAAGVCFGGEYGLDFIKQLVEQAEIEATNALDDLDLKPPPTEPKTQTSKDAPIVDDDGQILEELSEDEDDEIIQEWDDYEDDDEEEPPTKEAEEVTFDSFQKKVKVAIEEYDQKILALIFLRRAGERYSECRKELNNDFVKGIQAAKVPEGEQHDKIKVTCNRCGREGHYANKCYAKTMKDGSPIGNPNSRDETKAKVNVQFDADPEDFDFDDVLNQDELELGYGYLNSAHVIIQDNDSRICLTEQGGDSKMNPNWLLLDNQSTVHIFANPDFLINIRKVDRSLHLHTNVGSTIINEMGDLPGLGAVWLHRKGIANIISFHRVQIENKFGIEYTSTGHTKEGQCGSFVITTPNGITREFQPDGHGLYFIDCTNHIDANMGCLIFSTHEISDTMHVTKGNQIPTVSTNKSNFSKRDVLKAQRARRFQHIAGHPSEATMIKMATDRTINNCPILPRDIKIAKSIFGPSVYSLKGKTTWSKQATVADRELVPLPKSLEEYYKEVTLSADVLHVNKIPFLTTISTDIHYGTVHALPNMKMDNLSKAITAVIKSYGIRGFSVQRLLVDGQFKGIEQFLSSYGIHLTINIVSRGEHVPAAERYIRIIKERCRCIYSMLPFKRLPKRMIVGLLSNVVFYLNAFPWDPGVSNTLSPLTIVEGIPLDYNLHFQVLYGEYAQTYDGTDNTMRERTTGAIAMGPSGNLQGGVRFFSLSTGEFLDRSKHDFTLLPIPEDVLKRIDRMARKSRPGLSFTDRHSQPFPDSHNPDESDDDDDPDYIPPVDIDMESVSSSDTEDDFEPALDTVSTGVNNVPTNSNQLPIDPETLVSDDEADAANVPDDVSTDAESTIVPNTEVQTTGVQSTGVQSTGVQNTGVEDTTVPVDSSDDTSVSPQESYVTRSGRTVQSTQDDQFVYSHLSDPVYEATSSFVVDQHPTKIKKANPDEYQLFVNAVEYIEKSAEYDTFLQDFTMAQMSVRQGLKKYGADGKKSVMKEIENLVSRDCFGKVDYNTLTEEQKKNALPILMFMVMKRDGRLKSRGCADGRPQRLWTTKQEVSSPTPSIEAIRYILATAGLEGRDVATFDLPAQFLQTEMEELLHLKITGAVALLLCEFDPSWKTHLKKENGRPVIYAVCNKAIYGTLNAAILAYKKLTGHFAEWGYEMNPYEPCVWNKEIDKHQMTVGFHVDDGLATHIDPTTVTAFLKKLEEVYGKTDPLTITRGKRHEYLGMTIDFGIPGEVRISMYDYVQKLINKLPSDMIGQRATAAPEYLFKTNDKNAIPLEQDQADIFHTITATTLYLSIRTRPDLQLAVGFLCTRVREPDQHDWKKLAHLMKYLQRTRYLPLILRSDGNGSVIYMDGAHAVHADMKGHGGLFVTEGKGAMYSASGKIKINTLSSTETEFVQLGQKLPKCVWFRLFRIEQGGYAKEDILMQDNQSAMLLANNGRYSTGKGSKHVAIRYFFVTDRIKNKEFKIKFCPTKEMTADYLTKPLQGALFYKFRDAIQGVMPEHFKEYEKEYYSTVKQFGISLETKQMVDTLQGGVNNHRSVLDEGQNGSADGAKQE